MTQADYLALITPFFQREFDPNETLQWVRRNRLWCATWGFNSPTNWQNKALSFKVSGFHHKGTVLITLAWNDTYTVRLINTRGTIKKVFEEVYCDDLAELIDEQVERIADYDK